MNIETMEGRTLFSVTVSEISPGYYEFDGDAAADDINISVDMERHTLTYDGKQFENVAYVYVSGGAGNDTISVIADRPGDIGAAIDGGDDCDTILCNFDASIWGGNGNDEIHLSDAQQGQVYGEGGMDSVYISGYSANAIVDGGRDSDYIDATQNLYGVTIYGGENDDQIYGSNFDDTIYGESGADIIVSFGGDDTIYTSGDGGIDWIDAGDGYDSLYGDTVEIGIQNVENFG
jgi:hypothetical protein